MLSYVISFSHAIGHCVTLHITTENTKITAFIPDDKECIVEGTIAQKNTIHQLTNMLPTSKMSYFQAITTW